MNRTWMTRGLVTGMVVVALAAAPALAGAQGTVGGRVVDQQGNPVPDAEVTLDAPTLSITLTATTNENGEYARPGLMTGAQWNITVKKGNLVGGLNGVPVQMGFLEIPDIVLAPDPTGGKSAEELEMEAALGRLAEEANAAIDALDYDLAIAKYQEAAETVPECGLCFRQIGDLYMQKQQPTEAEQAYLQAIEFDPENVAAYNSLANIYNQQEKYDLAAEMSEKASSLGGALGGGGGDATSEFNAGAIAVNLMIAAQSAGDQEAADRKMAEAQAHYERAVELDPNMANAYYELGMLYVRQNRIEDAKKALAEYLRLEPNGANAEMANSIVSMP